MKKLFKVFLITVVGAVTQAFAANGRPNIVFLMSDDHKATAMGCMGNKEIETPNLDRLAGE